MAKDEIVSADEAAAIIHDGDTVAISGCVGIGTPDELLIAVERRFRGTNSSKLSCVRGGAGRWCAFIEEHCPGGDGHV